MTHLLELSLQSGRRSAAEVPYAPLRLLPGDFIDRLGETLPTELLGVPGCARLNCSQFLRLSRELEESFPDLRGIQVQLLKDLCLVANCSEEFFLSVSGGQWLRTKIQCEKHPNVLFSMEMIEQQCSTLISSITIHSIVVPCHPYWRKFQSMRGEATEVASKSPCFPTTVLEDALSEDKSLVEKLNEWEERNEVFITVNNQSHDEDGIEESKPFWKIEPHDVKIVNSNFVGAGNIWLSSWRGGIFIMKSFEDIPVDENSSEIEIANPEDPFYRELEVVRRLSHPHIVYSFGVSISTAEKRHSLLMESLDCDLFDLIEERGRLTGSSESPFSWLDSLDILLQIAKAMTYMHELAEPVIHGDLKPQNILVLSHDEIGGEILGDVCQFFVKVADFGSARILKQNSSSTFKPDGGTTKYAAPEVLVARTQKQREIEFPKKIDVYSYGILAFQVLTGFEPYEELLDYKGVLPRGFKEGVVRGNVRPRLREACGRPNFWNDPDLMALVESCWHREPSLRPEFSEVTHQLVSIYNNLNQNLMTGAQVLATPQANQVEDEPHDGPQNSMNGAHAFSTPQMNSVDDRPQVLEVQNRNGLSRSKRSSVFRMMLSCVCLSSRGVQQ